MTNDKQAPFFPFFFPLSNTTYKTSPPWALSLANAVGVVLSLFLILMHHYIAPPPHCFPTNARGSGFCIFFILMRLWHPHHDDGCLTFWKGNLFYMYLCALHKLKEGWVKTNYCRCPNSDEVIMVIDSNLYSILYVSLRIYISSMLYTPVIAGHHWWNVMYKKKRSTPVTLKHWHFECRGFFQLRFQSYCCAGHERVATCWVSLGWCSISIVKCKVGYCEASRDQLQKFSREHGAKGSAHQIMHKNYNILYFHIFPT